MFVRSMMLLSKKVASSHTSCFVWLNLVDGHVLCTPSARLSGQTSPVPVHMRFKHVSLQNATSLNCILVITDPCCTLYLLL
jgi:hypothetical protein